MTTLTRLPNQKKWWRSADPTCPEDVWYFRGDEVIGIEFSAYETRTFCYLATRNRSESLHGWTPEDAEDFLAVIECGQLPTSDKVRIS